MTTIEIGKTYTKTGNPSSCPQIMNSFGASLKTATENENYTSSKDSPSTTKAITDRSSKTSTAEGSSSEE
jgi:hypothetical protein